MKPEEKKRKGKPIETMEKEVTSFVKGRVKAADTGKPVVPCPFGSTSYFGLFNMGSSISVVPYTLYAKFT